MKTYNYSRQREAIYRFLLHRKDHPTAETIYQHVRQEYPRISLGTIYRNLSLLEEAYAMGGRLTVLDRQNQIV